VLRWDAPQFGSGTPVECGGLRWRVNRYNPALEGRPVW